MKEKSSEDSYERICWGLEGRGRPPEEVEMKLRSEAEWTGRQQRGSWCRDSVAGVGEGVWPG